MMGYSSVGAAFGTNFNPLFEVSDSSRRFSHSLLAEFANAQPYFGPLGFQNDTARVVRYVEIPTKVWNVDFDRVEMEINGESWGITFQDQDIVTYAGGTGTRFWYQAIIATRNPGNVIEWILRPGVSSGLNVQFDFFLGDNLVAVGVDTIPPIVLEGWVEFTRESGASLTNVLLTPVNLTWFAAAAGNAATATYSNIMATFTEYMATTGDILTLQQTQVTTAAFPIKQSANNYRLPFDWIAGASSLTDMRTLPQAVGIHLAFTELLVGQTPVLGGGDPITRPITDDAIFPNTVIEFQSLTGNGDWSRAFLLYYDIEVGGAEWIYDAASRGFIGHANGFNENWEKVDWNGSAQLTFFALQAGTYNFRLILREVELLPTGVPLYSSTRRGGQVLAQQDFSIIVYPNIIASLTELPFARPGGNATVSDWVTQRRTSVTEFLNWGGGTLGSMVAPGDNPWLPRGVYLRDLIVLETNSETPVGIKFNEQASSTNYTVQMVFVADDNTIFEQRTSAAAPSIGPSGNERRATINQAGRATGTDVSLDDSGSGINLTRGPSTWPERDQEQISGLGARVFTLTFRFPVDTDV
jgi:hypothetical protein